MAKDPAMLWYWSDWHSGTSIMSRFFKGCYMDILHAQFNNGPLSLEEIKVCLGSDFGTSWPAIQKKFKQTTEGLFFNERLEHEKEKRKEFSKSRRENINKRYNKSTLVDTSVVDVNILVEDVNENGDVIEIKKERCIFFKFSEIHRTFKQNGGSEDQARAFFNTHESTEWKIRGTPIVNPTTLIQNYINNWNKNLQNGPSKTSAGNNGVGRSIEFDKA